MLLLQVATVQKLTAIEIVKKESINHRKNIPDDYGAPSNTPVVKVTKRSDDI